MTGRSNSATTSRMMWMLSASSARRWSSCRTGSATSGDRAAVDMAFLGGGAQGPPQIQKPGVLGPGFDLVSAGGRRRSFHPISRTVAAGTSRVLVHQHAQRQQVPAGTMSRLCPRPARIPNRPGRQAREREVNSA